MNLILTTMGIYYAVTGIWPIFHMRSFEIVTGPKVDKWLVKMVGLLACSSGIIFLYSASQTGAVATEVVLLAVLNILSFMLIDIWYVLRKFISPIYLADAVVQAGYLALIAYQLTK